MTKLILLLSLVSFSCFPVELYDCNYSQGNKSTNKFIFLGTGTVVANNNKFSSNDSVHSEYQSPILNKENNNILLGENDNFVFAQSKDKTNYAIISKRGDEAYQWDQCKLDSIIDLNKLDYGKKPQNYTAVIKKYFGEILKDPESAKYSNFSKPIKEFIFNNKKPIGGYLICVDINAKNSYGGYTGAKRYWLLLKNGNVLRYSSEKIISRFHNANCQY